MIVGFLADIHEDILRLRRALQILDQYGCERIICLGDIVGFTLPFYQYIHTRDAESCIELIQARCTTVVAGNHDLYAIKKTPNYTAGFEYGDNWYDLDYSARAKKARNKIWLYEDNEVPPRLSSSSMEYLRNLREFERVALDDLPILATHFCYPDFSGSSMFFPSQTFHLKQHFHFLAEHGCRIGFSGHGHPEGCLVVDEDKYTLHDFGTIQLTDNPAWIVAPCVARTSRANGCLILDTEKKQIKVIPLKDS